MFDVLSGFVVSKIVVVTVNGGVPLRQKEGDLRKPALKVLH
jgi:hypothetical protein